VSNFSDDYELFSVNESSRRARGVESSQQSRSPRPVFRCTEMSILDIQISIFVGFG